MCGILCFSSIKNYSPDDLEQLSLSLDHRGPDSKYINSQKNEKSHTLNFIATQLIIVGSDPFPLKFPSPNKFTNETGTILIGNIEIYNYQTIYKELLSNQFSWDDSFSDAHVILPLLQIYLKKNNSIHEAFSTLLNILKGDFSLIVLLEKKYLLVARDRAGIRPLYFSQLEDSSFYFCSEVKPLLSLGLSHNTIRTVKPGTFTVIDLQEKVYSIQWQAMDNTLDQLCSLRNFSTSNITNAVNTISIAIRQALIDRIPSSDFALFLSGGIDSSLLLAMLIQLKLKTNYFVISVGFEGSSDLDYAQKLCDYLHIPLHKVIIETTELQQALPIIINILKQRFDMVNPVDVSIALPLYFASQKAKELHCKVAITGQGADEIFIGYKKYYEEDIVYDARRVIELVNKDIINIAEQNLERDDLISMHFSIEVRFPYLNIDLIKLIFQLNIASLYSYDKENRKILLRKIAEKEHLPSFITQRPKKAAQYGSQIMKNLYQLAKPYSSLKEYLESFR